LTTEEPNWGPFYDGRRQVANGTDRFEVLEAATGRPLASVAACGQADVDAAVDSARRAFELDWRLRSPAERAAAMHEVAAAIREHLDELAELLTRENGKPLRDALQVDINAAHLVFDHFASLATTVTGEILDQGTVEAHVFPEPYGVVAAVIPFNWPPVHFAGKCAPALAVGNTVVLKPGEQAPLAALRLIEIANQVLPPGVLNAVTGPDAGAPLVSHPDVSRVSFTGSTATGRKVMEGIARNLAVPSMELGGKNAAIVFADAEPEPALRTVVEGMFYNKGEACTSTARILVQESAYDEFLERFIGATSRLVVGDGLVESTDIGPVVDRRQRDRILSFIELGKQEGARLAMQGRIPAEEHLGGGFWVPPTVFAEVTPGMRLAQEEIFGPVACVMRFGDEDEAVEIANGTRYGLTAAVLTSDLERARRVARRLDVGVVFVNNYDRSTMVGSPFGGVGASGFGREMAAETLREFVRTKNVRIPGRQPINVWSSASRVAADPVPSLSRGRGRAPSRSPRTAPP
jgi:acyl-CoA reductase-like NAD-dependent aldehyde dehydrogenase